MNKQNGEANAMMIASVVILIIALVGGFFLIRRNTNPQAPITSEVTEMPTEEVSEAPTVEPSGTPAISEKMTESVKVIMSPQSDSQQKGTVTLTEVSGRVKIVLALTGYKSEVAQPSHIHTGTCAAPGKVVYGLKDVIDGKSETTLETTMADLKKQFPLIINVHKSDKEATVYTSCGDLK